MTNSEVEQAVARATGESRRVISRYGFSIVPDDCEPPTDVALVLDCPGCGTRLEVADLSELTDLDCCRCDAIYAFTADELYVADCATQSLAACA
jgi:hypothetical protein